MAGASGAWEIQSLTDETGVFVKTGEHRLGEREVNTQQICILEKGETEGLFRQCIKI